MASSAMQFSPQKIRKYINRLPLFTRVICTLIVILGILSVPFPSIATGGALIPSQVGLFSAHRLNTFPVVHATFLQLLLSFAALLPLLDRFEAEHGTLVCIALFAGPFATIPGVLYILIDHVIFRGDAPIQGASIWVFLLLGCEAVKLHRANPSFSLAGYNIPTWSSGLLAAFTLNFLIPHTSLLGHLCGAIVGYGFELAYLKFLVPPEKVLRWIEGKLNLLGRIPHYVSVDQKTYGRYGVLPSREGPEAAASARNLLSGTTQRHSTT